MNGLQRWALGMLKQHCGEQFKAAMGMSVDDMQAAFERGDSAAIEKVRAHGERLQNQSPEACRNAAAWAQKAFPGASAPGNTQNTNPTKLERTQ